MKLRRETLDLGGHPSQVLIVRESITKDLRLMRNFERSARPLNLVAPAADHHLSLIGLLGAQGAKA